MSFFSRLFGKKKAQPVVAEKKTVNLETLSLEALISVIQSGEDEQVRIAATQKITDQATLLKLSAIGDAPTVSASVQKAARQRLASLIDSGAVNGQQLSQNINDKAGLFALFGLVSDNQLFENLFNSISDENDLAKYALEGSTSKLRQRAAEKITNKDLLQQLLKDSKTRDKTVFKIIKEKCDAFKEEDKREAELLAGVTNALQALEQHSNRVYDGQYAAKFSYLQQQWESKKEHASPELIARAQAAAAKAQETIDSISAEERAQEAQRKAEAQADIDRQAHIQQLQNLLASIVSSEVNVEETFDLLRLLDAAWKSLGEIKKPSAAEQKTVSGLHRIITEELNAHRADGSLAQHHSRFASLAGEAAEEAAAYYQSLKNRVKNLTTSFGNELPEALAAAQAAYESWEKAANEKAAELQSAQRQIAGLIRKANETISAGVLGKAMGIRRAIDEKLQNLDNLPNHLANQLEQLDETLSKLQDWKNYAVVPKKHELIAQLEALEGSTEHPETLATKIKRLQEEWKALSKGGKDQEPELWEKFHELAQKVYQPCRDYFAEQANIRQQNLNALKQLVAQLKDYLENHDWANANWKEVGKVIRVARQEWRSYSPTERAATQPVQAEFETVLAGIQHKLNEEFARNDALKRELIAQAQQLVNVEDVRKATDEIKQLQARWQTIGASLRKDEQQLWREFRDQCDAVFARRQQQSNEFKAELEANLSAAKALVIEIEQLTQLTGQELSDARKRVDEIRQAFGALGQFPKAQVNDIKTAFNQAADSFEQKIKAERQHIKQQIWVNLLSANNAVRQYELDLAKGEAPDLEQLQVHIDAITHWPAGGLKAIQQKIARVTPAVDLEENLAALRELCIRADILTDSPTPASEQALRTAFQVNQLQQNFGRKSQSVAAEFENLIFEWVAVGAVATDDYEPLVARFNACRLKALE
jgi:DNA repair protein SbcC/Rad50